MLQACSCVSPAPDYDEWIDVNKLGYIGLHTNSGVNKKGDDCECQGKESEINKNPWCYLIRGHLLQDSVVLALPLAKSILTSYQSSGQSKIH